MWLSRGIGSARRNAADMQRRVLVVGQNHRLILLDPSAVAGKLTLSGDTLTGLTARVWSYRGGSPASIV